MEQNEITKALLLLSQRMRDIQLFQDHDATLLFQIYTAILSTPMAFSFTDSHHEAMQTIANRHKSDRHQSLESLIHDLGKFVPATAAVPVLPEESACLNSVPDDSLLTETEKAPRVIVFPGPPNAFG